MLDTKGRYLVEKPVKWLAVQINKTGITPNQVTLMAFVLGAAAGTALALHYFTAGLLLLWVSGLLDVLDGQLARLQKRASKAGALLDMILDRVVEGCFVAGLAIAVPEAALAVIAFLITVVFNFSTFLAAGALVENTGEKSMHYDIGLIERTETFLFLTVAALWPGYSTYSVGALALLIMITGVVRFVNIFRLLKEDRRGL